MDVNVEIVGKGRGLSFKRNTRIAHDDNGDIALEVIGEPQECLLGMVPGIVQDDPDRKVPFLLFPDGSGEIALYFEKMDETGNWIHVDIQALC